MRPFRRRSILFVVSLLAVAAALPLLGAGDPAPPAEKYALLVGVRQYDPNELRDLPYAEDDVTALADVLKKAGYKRVVLMTQTEGAKQARFLPLAANVRKALKGILEDRAEGDTVLVAFAGHGVQYKDEEENYFCPMDTKLADKSTLLPLGEVYKELEKSGAGTRFLLADCCRNDPRSDQARAVDRVKLESVTRPQRAAPPGGVAALFSCSAGEKAFESADLKHGVFFHFVIEGLQGKADLDRDGQVDLDELSRYVKRQVPDFVKEQYSDDVRQMPELIGKTRGTVALIRLDGASEPAPETTADNKETIRNPFQVKDVPDPDGDDVQTFASGLRLARDADDANAEQWASRTTAGKVGSLNGEWSSRWNGGSAGDDWVEGTARVKRVGNRVYILYIDSHSTFLIDAKLQGKSRLVGRYLNQNSDDDSYPWVGEIVSGERIDGAWTNGRWDLRRKITGK